MLGRVKTSIRFEARVRFAQLHLASTDRQRLTHPSKLVIREREREAKTRV